MKYPHPLQAVTGALRAATADHTVSLKDSAGLSIDVQHLAGVGWCFEPRYDRVHGASWRAPFTGAQSRLTCSPLAVQHLDGQIAVETAEGSARWNDSAAGAFSLSNPSGEVIFRSSDIPFSWHAQAVDLYEGVSSLKITDFSDRSTTPLQSGKSYSSHMVRFQYPRPSGVVLGLPGQTGEINRNGYRFQLYNNDQFTHTPDRPSMYQSWPILIHRGLNDTGWVGVFHDNPARTFVDIGDFYPELVTFEATVNNSRVYIAWAETLPLLTQKLVTLLGDAALPPAWAFGYQQCRWSYMSTSEVRSVVRRMREAEIPLDAVYFDIDYMRGYRVFTRDPNNFSDLRETLEELHAADVKSVCIIDPGVKVEKEYQAYKRLMAEGKVLTDADGEPFPMVCWAGPSVLPDFGAEETQQVWSEMQQEWLSSFPFDGVWNDMNEPANFDGGNGSTGKAFSERGSVQKDWNLYGYRMAKASALGWRNTHPGKRGVIITRSGYPGVQQHAVIWHGDNQAWWEHLRLALDTAVQYSLCGAFYTGPDVPGFTGNPPDDLAVRFFQLGAWLPLFRGHSIYFAKDKEPYAFAPVSRELIKDAIVLRYSLLREWYSGFERAVRERLPVLQPVFSRGGRVARDQFILFDKFLVAPITERDQEVRSVYLPDGTWYDFSEPESQGPLEGGRWVEVPVDLATMPVFVRAGSIVVRNSPRQNVRETFLAPEIEQIFPDKNGEATGYWFNDDGISLEDSKARRISLTYQAGKLTRTDLTSPR